MAKTFFSFDTSLNVSTNNPPTLSTNQLSQIKRIYSLNQSTNNLRIKPQIIEINTLLLVLCLFFNRFQNGELLSDRRIEDFEDGRNEEEYDARNDETFGGDLPSSDDDWEQQHEQFAEVEENIKLSEEIGE